MLKTVAAVQTTALMCARDCFFVRKTLTVRCEVYHEIHKPLGLPPSTSYLSFEPFEVYATTSLSMNTLL